MSLTAKQTEALQKIADNPGNVVAWARFSQLKDMIRINGNIEQKLSGLGLIREIGTGRQVRFRHQGTWTISGEINAWELTDAGREAIGIKVETAPEIKPSRFARQLQQDIGLRW